MTFEEIHENWSQDGTFDRTKMMESALDRFVLHNKYWKIYNQERAILFRMKAEQATFKEFLKEYWTSKNCDVSNEDLEKYGYPIRDVVAIPKVSVDDKIAADPKWISLNLKYSLQNQKCEFLEDIIQSIKYRNKDIENFLTAVKLSEGRE